MDMVFPVENDNIQELHVVYNRQAPLCDEESDTNCKQISDLCKADNSFTLDFSSPADHVVFLFNTILKDEMMYLVDSSFKGILPLPLRLGIASLK
jgi:hypothetical protein